METKKVFTFLNDGHPFALTGWFWEDGSLEKLELSCETKDGIDSEGYTINLLSNKEIKSIFLRLCSNSYWDLNQAEGDRKLLTDKLVVFCQKLKPKEEPAIVEGRVRLVMTRVGKQRQTLAERHYLALMEISRQKRI